MDFSIELRPHVGQRQNAEGQLVDVEFDQYLIIVTAPEMEKVRGRAEEHIGFVGKKPGAPIVFLAVAAAFGNETLAVFRHLVREALVAKARERLDRAKAVQDEAQKLKEETDVLAAQASEIGAEADDVEVASAAAIDAIDSANQELEQAARELDQEQEKERASNDVRDDITTRPPTPDAFVSSGETQQSEEANAQNL